MKFLALSAVLTAACCSSPPSNSARMAAVGNVWQLHNGGSSASGVPIAIRDGELWMLTARHVPEVESAQGWHALHRDGTHLDGGRVVSLSPDQDVAIMAFPLGDYAPVIVRLNYDPLEFGAQVYGAGWAGGHYLWLTTGLVSGLDRATSPMSRGDSGGGLFNEQGELLAILVGLHGSVTHLASVVPLADIEAWLKKNLEEPVAEPA